MDRGVWATWYNLPDQGRGDYLAWLHGSYLPDRPKLKSAVRKDISTAELGEAVKAFGANFGTWSVNEAEKMLVRKYELALVPNNDNNETKQSISLAKDELRKL